MSGGGIATLGKVCILFRRLSRLVLFRDIATYCHSLKEAKAQDEADRRDCPRGGGR
jgi:hypothetical protein